MANINTFLTAIKTAVLGEDMRDAIYNSIDTINQQNDTILQTAKSDIDQYIDLINLIEYGSELPATGDDKKIYAISDSFNPSYSWSNDYSGSAYTSSINQGLVRYLANEQADITGNWPNATHSTFSDPLNNSDYFSPIGSLIFNISGYIHDQADVSNPEWGMLALGGYVRCGSVSSTVTVALRSVLNTNTRYDTSKKALPIIFKNNTWNIVPLTDWIDSYVTLNGGRISIFGITLQAKEYIYDKTTESWIYNRTVTKALSLTNAANDVPLFLNFSGLGVIYNSSYCEIGGLLTVQQTPKAAYSYINAYRSGSVSLTQSYSDRETRVTIFNEVIDPGERVRYLPQNRACSLLDPLIIMADLGNKVKLYLWNSQLNRFLELVPSNEYLDVNVIYNVNTGTYTINKTYAEIDAYISREGNIYSALIRGYAYHPGPGRYSFITWHKIIYNGDSSYELIYFNGVSTFTATLTINDDLIVVIE